MAKGKRSKKRKNKLNNFTKILLILVVMLISISIAPNYIKQFNNEQEIVCLLNNEDINDKLNDDIKIDEYGNIFMTYEDIKNNLDSTIYKEGDSVITVGNTSVAILNFNENKIKINGVDTQVLSTMYKDENDKIYIPISELNNVYNIETSVINNIAVIRSLDGELIKYDARKDINVKYKCIEFSKTIDKVGKGQKVIFVEKVNNNWVKICTQNGIVGYVKEDLLTNEVVIREKMDYDINNNEENINSKDIDVTNMDLSTYQKREKEVNKVLKDCIKNGINIVKLNNQEANNQNGIERFYIELLPRLKEIGIKVIK